MSAMGGPITLGSFPSYSIKNLVTIAVGDFKMPPLQFLDLFDSKTSDKSFEMSNLVSNFTVAVAKPQGQATQYVGATQRYSTFFNHQTFALGYEITMEAKQDQQSIQLTQRYTKQLMKAARRNQEYRGANVYNRGFDSGYTGGDGQPLFSLVHPTATGNQANVLPNQSSLSEASLEDMCNLANNFKDFEGNPTDLFTESLHIAVAQQFEAERILNSVAQSGTANNDINAIRSLAKFPKGIKVNKYFDSDNRFFIRTNCDEGMVHYDRMNPTLSQDNAFDIEVDKVKIIFRDSFGWEQWLAALANGNF
jgi:hypothetical protein